MAKNYAAQTRAENIRDILLMASDARVENVRRLAIQTIVRYNALLPNSLTETQFNNVLANLVGLLSVPIPDVGPRRADRRATGDAGGDARPRNLGLSGSGRAALSGGRVLPEVGLRQSAQCRDQHQHHALYAGDVHEPCAGHARVARAKLTGGLRGGLS